MLTSQFLVGALLVAFLVEDVCCLPLKKGSDSGAASSGGGFLHVGPSSSGFAEPSHANRRPVGASFSSGSYGPAPSGSGGSAAILIPAGSTLPGGSIHAGGPGGYNWAVDPPSLSAGGEEGAGFGGAEGHVSPALPPPGPQFQGGELYHLDKVYESGDSESEYEDQGYMAPSSSAQAASPGANVAFLSHPVAETSPVPGYWGFYPRYDYMFLTGQYPPGTYSDYSNSYEEGRDHWYDDHYMRHYIPYSQEPVQAKGAVSQNVLQRKTTFNKKLQQ